MKTPPEPAADELDLSRLFFKLRRRWPLFVGALMLAGALAYVYLQLTPPVYGLRATVLLGDQATGSKRAQELLQILEVHDKGLKMEDEIGLITSAGTVRQAVRRLPYAVAYFREPATWLNRLRPVQRREQPADAMPFRVLPNLAAPQLTDVRIYVSPAGAGRYRLRATAARAHLADLPTGQPVREVWNVQLDTIVAAGDTLRHPLLQLAVQPVPGVPFEAGTGRYCFTLSDVDGAAGRYANGLAVRPIDHDSRIVELRLKNSVPAQGQAFLDTLMAVYIAADLRAKNQTGRKSLAFLDEEIEKLARTRHQAAGALSTFRASRGVVDVQAQSSSDIGRLADLEAARARAATTRRYCESMLAYLQANRGGGQMASPSSAGIDDGVLNSLILQLNELNSRRAALSVNGSDANPLLVVTDERIRSTKEALMQTLANMSRNAGIGLRDLDAQLARVRGQISRMPEDERQLASLKGESDFNEKNYSFLVEKRNEAALALATNTTDKRVVDRAQLISTGPESPNPKLVALIALLAGLLLPTGLVLLLDKANQTVQGQDDLARITSIPVLGVVAHGSGADTKDLAHRNRGAIAESFRSIRVNLQYLTSGPDKKVLGVTSTVPGEGKTFCAVNLATELAHSGRRVVLVETDLRRPTVAGYFPLAAGSARHGLAGYLGEESTLDECRRFSGVPGLDLITCGAVPDRPTQLLENPRMATLMRLLRAEYDYVVLDTPPVGFVAEFFVLMQYLDATVYVVRHNYTDRDLVSRINELYQDEKIRQVYLLINDVRFAGSYEYRHQRNAYSYYK
ncbi:polysaccharide biosynthesis tyrosine autokinase [Hymenobacter convexus]|uniref:polysaccharide biosynthesis tyrosine autokinase n=1 Tax=Hymenobacter sp. CA1UV-4 TaxID=3063782 RepID=UPI00271314D6|nr:polysaccharide biosynthesis tyrosine autokinase [Hymenobacter sp. CA1UV-4]MDO7852504.1 polysaccharide biosynthesis tyrosine autokinase [Hymenobacter sp. CA1UV-4]